MSKHTWFADEESPDWSLMAAKPNRIEGTAGDDRLTGTDGAENFRLEQGGSDRARGLGGDDRFYMGSTLDAGDWLDGGDGFDTVVVGYVRGGEVPHLLITSDMFRGIEQLSIAGGTAMHVELGDGLPDLKIQPSFVDPLFLDASALTTGSVRVRTGNQADVLIGGAGDDQLNGGTRDDLFTGGPGNDLFMIRGEFDSHPVYGVDTITDLSVGDLIALPKIEGGYDIGNRIGHMGDIVLAYDQEGDRTTVTIYLDHDPTIDMMLYLSGSHLDLQVSHSSFLIAA